MDTGTSEQALIRLLRARLSDDRPSRDAFQLFLDDSNATDATVEIRYGVLSTVVFNSVRSEDLKLPLSNLKYRNVGLLLKHLNAQSGYRAVQAEQYDPDHPSEDLVLVGFGDLKRGGVTFRHRRFADAELRDLLRQGIARHNMSYSLETVPANEHQFVLDLAQCEALRMLATNAVKRRGLDATVDSLIDLADSYERSYKESVRRQQRAVPVPEIIDDTVGEGDVVQGELYRRSARTGFVAPMAANLPPERPTLYEPKDEDITDITVKLTWRRARDYDFYAMELWRDTTEDVKRTRTGIFSRNPSANTRNETILTTSKLVFQSFGASSNFDTAGFATFLEEFGQLITSFVDGLENQNNVQGRLQAPPMEPNTVYYYKLYFVDLNYEILDSMSVRVKTKDLRALADATTPFDVSEGPIAGGTAVTMTGVRFHEGMKVKIGDAFVNSLVVVNTTTATFTTPQKFNEQAINTWHDLVVISKNGLEDIVYEAWKYVA